MDSPSPSTPTGGLPAQRLDGGRSAGAASVEDRIFREIVRLREAGIPAALATVIGIEGSAPAKAAMKILVRADGSTLGSVGGGCLEEEVKRLAAEVIEEDRTARFAMRLTAEDSPGGALLCGGSVEVFVEPVSAPSLVLFGGGHVSRAVADLAARVGFRVVVTDDRTAYAAPARFPMAAETRLEYPGVAARDLPLDGSTYVLVMTRTHSGDREILAALHARGARPRYLGMIGSATKVREVFDQLRSDGVSPEWLLQVRCPVGLKIGARTADEIAVSVVAEMTALRRGKFQGRWNLSRSGGEVDPNPALP